MLEEQEQVQERGKLVATYIVRVTLRDSGVEGERPRPPKVADLEAMVRQSIHSGTTFLRDEIRVSAERADR